MKRLAIGIAVLLVVSALIADAGAKDTAARAAPDAAAQRSCSKDSCVPNVTARIQVGPEPWTVVSAAGSIWVGNDLGVARVDPATNLVEATVPIGGVGDVAYGDGSVWVESYSADAVGQVDLATNTVPHTIHVDGPSGIAIGEGASGSRALSRGRSHGSIRRTQPPLQRSRSRRPPQASPGWPCPARAASPSAEAPCGRRSRTPGKSCGSTLPPTRSSPRWMRGATPAWRSLTSSCGSAATTIRRSADRFRDEPGRRHHQASRDAVRDQRHPRWSLGPGRRARRGDRTIRGLDRPKIQAADGIYSGVASLDGDIWLGRLATQSTVGSYEPDAHVFRVSPGTSAPLPVQITTGVPYTKSVACGRYDSPSGSCSLQTDVYSLAGGVHEPVIVLAHGGWCSRGCRPYLAQLASALSLQGAVVFNVDVRQGNQPTDTYHDLACAVRFARATATLYGGEIARITLVGHSMGSQRGSTVALAGDDFKGGCLAKGEGARRTRSSGCPGCRPRAHVPTSVWTLISHSDTSEARQRTSTSTRCARSCGFSGLRATTLCSRWSKAGTTTARTHLELRPRPCRSS